MEEVDSSSSSESEIEGESEGEENPSEDEVGKAGIEVSNEGSKKRRRRRKKSLGHRRKLRSKYESIEDFNPEARTAQTEELERIRRLELQQSLTVEQSRSEDEDQVSMPGIGRGRESALGDRGGESTEVMVVDLTEGLKDDDSSRSEAIVIDSGSDSEEEQQPPKAKRPRETTEGEEHTSRPVAQAVSKAAGKMSRGKYDTISPMSDGRVVINLGHPADEPDIFLAPQIIGVAKPHQVSGCSLPPISWPNCHWYGHWNVSGPLM